jgi:histone deacetylase 6
VDGVKDYIDWAVGQNFGVMDVNIPGYVTREEVSHTKGQHYHADIIANCGL